LSTLRTGARMRTGTDKGSVLFLDSESWQQQSLLYLSISASRGALAYYR
jgi:hypothetical protein